MSSVSRMQVYDRQSAINSALDELLDSRYSPQVRPGRYCIAVEESLVPMRFDIKIAAVGSGLSVSFGYYAPVEMEFDLRMTLDSVKEAATNSLDCIVFHTWVMHCLRSHKDQMSYQKQVIPAVSKVRFWPTPIPGRARPVAHLEGVMEHRDGLELSDSAILTFAECGLVGFPADKGPLKIDVGSLEGIKDDPEEFLAMMQMVTP